MTGRVFDKPLNYYNKYYQRLDYVGAGVLAFVYFFNPILGLLACFSWIVIKGINYPDDYRLSGFFCAFSAGFLGLINSTKLPENDLIWYLEGYYEAGNLDFFDYIETFGINGQGLEVVFPALNYCIYSVFGDNGSAYVFIITFLYYGIISHAVIRFCLANKLSSISAVFAVLCFAMSPNIFSTSAVILRQNIASAVILFVLVESIFYRRNHYFLMLAVPFIHASSVFFLALLLIPGLRNRISFRNFHWYAVAFISIFSYQYVAGLLLSVFPSDGLIGYILMRASLGTTYDLPPLGFTKILFDLLLVAVFFIVVYFFPKPDSNILGLVKFSNIIAAVCFFIVSNLEYVELSVRFNFYYLGFFPFVVALFFSSLNKILAVYLALGLQVPLVFLFYYSLHESSWTYRVIDELFYYPFFYYFNI